MVKFLSPPTLVRWVSITFLHICNKFIWKSSTVDFLYGCPISNESQCLHLRHDPKIAVPVVTTRVALPVEQNDTWQYDTMTNLSY